MTLDLPSLVPAVLSGLGGIIVGSWKVGKRDESLTRDLQEIRRTTEALLARDEIKERRIGSLETSGAVVTEKLSNITGMLEEMRSDLKTMKDR